MSADSAAAPGAADLTDFVRSTAVREERPGRYLATVQDGWSAPAGPNGGYLAAILTRGLEAHLAREGDWRLRSLTTHFLRPARTGPMELEVETIRSGRRMASARITGHQDGRETITALAAFSAPDLDAVPGWAPRAPNAGPAPALDGEPVDAQEFRRRQGRWVRPMAEMAPITQRVRLAPELGGVPFGRHHPEPGAAVETGGWVALAERQRIDAALLVLLTDVWWPPAFDAVKSPVMAPTIDLTVHIRATLPPGGLDPAPLLCEFRSTAAVDGLVEEDARLFLPDGTLAAQSRQLALLAPVG